MRPFRRDAHSLCWATWAGFLPGAASAALPAEFRRVKLPVMVKVLSSGKTLLFAFSLFLSFDVRPCHIQKVSLDSLTCVWEAFESYVSLEELAHQCTSVILQSFLRLCKNWMTHSTSWGKSAASILRSTNHSCDGGGSIAETVAQCALHLLRL